MIILGWLLLALGNLLIASQSLDNGCPMQGRAGGFSRLSVDLCFQDFENERRQLEIPSPDQSLRLVVNGMDGQVYAQDRKVGPSIGIVNDEEVIWSPDSRAILFTLSFGAAGPVSAAFSGVRGASAADNETSVTQTIRADFASHHSKNRCHAEANVGGLAWLDGSRKAVFVAEVPPSPQCEKDGGYFEGYVVSFPDGSILERYSMKETIRRWRGVLGSRLEDDIALLKDR
jgi:hypothetical protein